MLVIIEANQKIQQQFNYYRELSILLYQCPTITCISNTLLSGSWCVNQIPLNVN